MGLGELVTCWLLVDGYGQCGKSLSDLHNGLQNWTPDVRTTA